MRYVENSYLELKEIINSAFKKEIIAFANTDGGEIIVGVADDGRIVGVLEPEKDMEQISNMIRDGIKPDLTSCTSIETLEAEGKTLIRVAVSRGVKRPYHLSDKGLKPSGVFIRHGITSAPASDENIRQMIKESDGTTFDKARAIHQDLTFSYAEGYFEACKVAFNYENKKTLGLIDGDGYFTNAALLLSDQCEHSIKCAVYDGIGKTKFKARKEFFGSILKQLDEAYEFISLNNNLSSEFQGLHRIDQYDYPPYALREALLNTIVHRDYDYSGSILVNIFADRMEFVSIGGLVKGITLTDVMHGVSQSRNMVIAAIFYRLKLIESYGTGIQRIMESYEGNEIKPEFIPGPASFVVILKNLNSSNYRSQYLSERIGSPSLRSAESVSESSSGYMGDGRGMDKIVQAALTDKEKVLLLLKNKQKIGRKDIEELLECSAFPANRILTELLDEGKIERIGKARATRYILK